MPTNECAGTGNAETVVVQNVGQFEQCIVIIPIPVNDNGNGGSIVSIKPYKGIGDLNWQSSAINRCSHDNDIFRRKGRKVRF